MYSSCRKGSAYSSYAGGYTDKDIPGASVQELATSAKKDQDSVNSLYLKIGDKEYNYEDLLKYRAPTDAFDVVWADKAIFGILEGRPSKAVAAQSSLICPDPDCADPNFVQ